MNYKRFNRNLITDPLNKQEMDFLNLKVMEISDAVAKEQATDYQEKELEFIIKTLQTSLKGLKKNKAKLRIVA